jgi:hypothetical protein
MEAFISCSKSLDVSLFKVFVKEMEALLKCLFQLENICLLVSFGCILGFL